LPGGDFYDDKGVYFNEEGLDGNGGFYDDDGKYVKPKVCKCSKCKA